LTFIIKQDIAGINKQIAALQSYVKHRQGPSSSEGRMVDEHNNNVVMMLQNNLATTSMTFKDVLELRTQVFIVCSNATDHSNNSVKEYEGI
jgi:syntaxin 5